MTNIFYILSHELYIFLFRISGMDKQNTFNRWYGKFCAVCLILQISTDIYLRIHEYFITYPRIFYYVSTVTQVFLY